MLVCDTCLRAIRSRSEKVIEVETIDVDEDNPAQCEWCENDYFDALIRVRFD